MSKQFKEFSLRASTLALTLAIVGVNNLSYATTANLKLTDIKGHWAQNQIQQFINNGYINGYEDLTFRPENSMTRAEFVKVVNKYFGFTSKGSESFTDVNSKDWFYNDVCIAIKAGYINGYEDSTFRPNKTITREEVLKIVVSIKNKLDTNYDKINKFKDSNSISNWAKPYVEGAIEEGYLVGDAGYIKPTHNIKRSEAVTMLSRIDNKPVVNNAPEVTANSIEIKQGDNFSYDMLGAKATDAEGDKVTITYEGTVKTNEPGKYTITVIATDYKGAVSKTTVTVTVKETVKDKYNANDEAFKQLVLNEMVSLVNDHRAGNNLYNLNLDSRLVSSANTWSKHMVDTNTFEHVINGNMAIDICPELKNNWNYFAENIAMCQISVTENMEQDAKNLANKLFVMWKNSPGHNKNMLNSNGSLFGFGFNAVQVREGVYTIWATQHFATLKK